VLPDSAAAERHCCWTVLSDVNAVESCWPLLLNIAVKGCCWCCWAEEVVVGVLFFDREPYNG